MHRLVAWIRRHQLISFFALVYLISFGIGISGVYIFRGDKPVYQALQFFIVRMLLYGPALSGLIVARAADTGEREGSRGTRWPAFVI